MSAKQDLQGVRTPADVEQKYGLGKQFSDIYNLLNSHKSALEEQKATNDKLYADLEYLRTEFVEYTEEFAQLKAELDREFEDIAKDLQVSKQDLDNTKAELQESIDNDVKALAGFKSEVSSTYATISAVAQLESNINTAIAGVKQEASETYAKITSLTALDTKTTNAIAGVKQEASETYATISALSDLETEARNATAALRQEVTDNYATIDSLASYATKDEQTKAIAGLRSEVAGKYATIESLAEYVTEEEQTEAIAGVKQYADGKYATIESVTSLETNMSNAIAGLRQEVADEYATIESVAAVQTANNTAIAGLRSDVSDNYAKKSDITSFVTEYEQTEAIASVEQEVANNYAKISSIAAVVDANGNVTTSSIIQGINDGKSSILLAASRIDLSGYVTIAGLSGGTTTIDGSCIKTGVIDADRIDADSLKVAAANITGKLTATQIDATNLKVSAANISGALTIGQLPSTVAETGDIPTKVSQLTNDSGYQNESGVVSIIDGRITADYVEALEISVGAAQIDGKLTAAQIDTATLLAGYVTVGDLEDGMTTIDGSCLQTGIIKSKNYTIDSSGACTAGMRINLDNGMITTPSFRIAADGGLYILNGAHIDGGYIGGFMIDSAIRYGKEIYDDDNAGVYIGLLGIGCGADWFVNDSGYMYADSARIGGFDVTSAGIKKTNTVQDSSYGYITYKDVLTLDADGISFARDTLWYGESSGYASSAKLYRGEFWVENKGYTDTSPVILMNVLRGSTQYQVYLDVSTMTVKAEQII